MTTATNRTEEADVVGRSFYFSDAIEVAFAAGLRGDPGPLPTLRRVEGTGWSGFDADLTDGYRVRFVPEDGDLKLYVFGGEYGTLQTSAHFAHSTPAVAVGAYLAAMITAWSDR